MVKDMQIALWLKGINEPITGPASSVDDAKKDLQQIQLAHQSNSVAQVDWCSVHGRDIAVAHLSKMRTTKK